MLVLFEAPVNTYSGYGSHSRDILRSLYKIYPDWEYKIIATRWGNTPQNYLDEKKDNDIIKNLLTAQLTRQPDIYIQITVPNEFRKVGKFNIGITAGIESDKCSQKWLEGINRMDLIITTSTHSQEVFKSTKYEGKTPDGRSAILECNKPIEVLFEGVDLNIYGIKDKYCNNIIKSLDEIKEDFCFLFVGHWLKGALSHDRKDVGGMILTFLKTFRNYPKDKRPALVLKTSTATFSQIDYKRMSDSINALRQSDDEPNIYLLHGGLTDEEINTLYNHSKIKSMISFTHGEGYGRPLAEFATCDKPIIVSGWSGQLDFLNRSLTTLLSGELKEIHPSVIWKHILIKESKWFYVDYDKASIAIKDIFDNYNKYKKNAKLQGKLIREYFSYDNMVNKLFDILKPYVETIPEEVELVLPKLEPINIDSKIIKGDKIVLPTLKEITKEELTDSGSELRTMED